MPMPDHDISTKFWLNNFTHISADRTDEIGFHMDFNMAINPEREVIRMNTVIDVVFPGGDHDPIAIRLLREIDLNYIMGALHVSRRDMRFLPSDITEAFPVGECIVAQNQITREIYNVYTIKDVNKMSKKLLSRFVDEEAIQELNRLYGEWSAFYTLFTLEDWEEDIEFSSYYIKEYLEQFNNRKVYEIVLKALKGQFSKTGNIIYLGGFDGYETEAVLVSKKEEDTQ